MLSRFTVVILAITLLPAVFFLGVLPGAPSGWSGFQAVLFFLGGAHVAATVPFYVDPLFRPALHADRRNYVWIPAGIVLGTGLFYAVAPPHIEVYMSYAYTTWLLWHYGKQNVGVLAFTLRAEGEPPVRQMERWLLAAVAIAGMLAISKIMMPWPYENLLHRLINPAYAAAKALYVAVALAFAAYAVHGLATGAASLKRLGLLGLLCCFFLPAVLCPRAI
jgi:hypothetical protein